MVRLELDYGFNLDAIDQNFNSLMVRLELNLLAFVAYFLMYFNSLMVRLELSDLRRQIRSGGIFQFLNGAIGVQAHTSTKNHTLIFQFLNGAIGVLKECKLYEKALIFQFLNGAIGVQKTIGDFCIYFHISIS